MVANGCRANKNALSCTFIRQQPGELVRPYTADLPSGDSTIPSGNVHYRRLRFEREIKDLFGIGYRST